MKQRAPGHRLLSPYQCWPRPDHFHSAGSVSLWICFASIFNLFHLLAATIVQMLLHTQALVQGPLTLWWGELGAPEVNVLYRVIPVGAAARSVPSVYVCHQKKKKKASVFSQTGHSAGNRVF